MELLTHHDYKTLKLLKSKEMLYDDIVLKIGKSSKERLIRLQGFGYLYMSSKTDKWGKPQKPLKYLITEKGMAYLEDHKYLVFIEWRTALCKSIIAPIVVSILTNIVMNSNFLEKIYEFIIHNK